MLVNLAVAVADGATTISDIAVLADQAELFGAVASDSTCWRLLDQLGRFQLNEVDRVRRWRPPNISSLACTLARLGADPLHMLFEQVGAHDAAGAFCCELRVVSVDCSTTDVPNGAENAKHFGRQSNAIRGGPFPQVRSVVAAESGTGH